MVSSGMSIHMILVSRIMYFDHLLLFAAVLILHHTRVDINCVMYSRS